MIVAKFLYNGIIFRYLGFVSTRIDFEPKLKIHGREIFVTLCRTFDKF